MSNQAIVVTNKNNMRAEEKGNGYTVGFIANDACLLRIILQPAYDNAVFVDLPVFHHEGAENEKSRGSCK